MSQYMIYDWTDGEAVNYAKQLTQVVTVEKQIENGGSEIIYDGRS
jgi:hypothetical protein